MLEKKDCFEFCKELMRIEIEMEHDALGLIKYIKDEEAVAILKRIVEDEKRHEKIVEKITKIIEIKYA